MTHQTTAPALTTSELVSEIEQTLRAWRADRELHAPDDHHAPCLSAETTAHERDVMLDVTIALLIRHRLPIDADRAARAVHRAQSDDVHLWATACAEHVVQIAQESTP